MKASRLAEIQAPQDAGTLEDELWRSLPASSPSTRQDNGSQSPLWQRPFPAPANDRIPPAADVPRNAPAQPEPPNQDIVARSASAPAPQARIPAHDPVEEAGHRHYDWDCKIADDPVEETPTRFEKLDRIYQALAVRLGWITSVSPRALALPAAGVVVVGGLIAGMTLLYDPLSHPAAEPAAAGTLKAEVAAQPLPPVVVPQTGTAQQAAMAVAAAPVPAAAVPQPQPQATVSALETSNERWARTEGEQASPAPDQNPPATAAKDATPSQPEATAFADEEKTAAIPADKPAAVQSAAANETPPANTAKPQPAASIGKGRITTAVNMRAGPADESKVLRTIPARATVDIITCKGWCKVAYEGQQGWIYKKFLNRS